MIIRYYEGSHERSFETHRKRWGTRLRCTIEVMYSLLKLSCGAFVCVAVLGCPPSMESTVNKLLLRNESDIEIITLLNLSYPDSSLANSFLDSYLDPKSEGYLGNIYELEDRRGLTLFVFDQTYFKSQWHEDVGTPDTYLEEDKILKRWVLSKQELDSLSWTLVYP